MIHFRSLGTDMELVSDLSYPTSAYPGIPLNSVREAVARFGWKAGGYEALLCDGGMGGLSA